MTEKASSSFPYVPVRVWDLPTRLFHWALVLLVGFSWLSAQLNWNDWHLLSGYTILALLLFRLAWGVVGSETAPFRHFLASPFAALRHSPICPSASRTIRWGTTRPAAGWCWGYCCCWAFKPDGPVLQ